MVAGGATARALAAKAIWLLCVLSGDEAVAALESNAWTMFSILGTGEGGRVIDTPTRLVVEAPIPQPPHNGVWRFYDEADRSLRQQVAELLAPFSDRGVVAMWLVHPTTPPNVRDRLAGGSFLEAKPGRESSTSLAQRSTPGRKQLPRVMNIGEPPSRDMASDSGQTVETDGLVVAIDVGTSIVRTALFDERLDRIRYRTSAQLSAENGRQSWVTAYIVSLKVAWRLAGLAGVDCVFVDHLHEGGSQRAAMP